MCYDENDIRGRYREERVVQGDYEIALRAKAGDGISWPLLKERRG